MNTINKLDKITEIITKIFAYVAGAALLFNVVIILANVIMRAFGKAIVGTEEYVSVAEVVLIFLAMGYTQYSGGLVHVCFFMKKLPKLGPVILWALNQWVGVGIIALLAYQNFMQISKIRQVTTALLIPLKPFYGVIAVGCVIYGIAQLYMAVKSTVALFNAEVREDVISKLPA